MAEPSNSRSSPQAGPSKEKSSPVKRRANAGRPRKVQTRLCKRIVPPVLGRPRKRRSKTSLSTSTERWTLQNKKQLLEGVKRFGPDELSKLAGFVEGKMASQIEEKLQQLRQAGSHTLRRRKDSEDEKASLEVWIELIQDLTKYELADFSSIIGQVMGYMARNEPVAENVHARFSWRNLNKFVSDLCENKSTVASLSDLESLVVLDMMHNLGQKLHSADIADLQRQLALKYRLLKWKSDDGPADRGVAAERMRLALANEFDPEVNTSTQPNSSVDSLPQMSGETANMEDNAGTGLVATAGSSRLWPESTAGGHVSSCQEVGIVGQVAKTFFKPKLYTLNPLCVPDVLLELKSKDK